jgi:hypothetical protein
MPKAKRRLEVERELPEHAALVPRQRPRTIQAERERDHATGRRVPDEPDDVADAVPLLDRVERAGRRGRQAPRDLAVRRREGRRVQEGAEDLRAGRARKERPEVGGERRRRADRQRDRCPRHVRLVVGLEHVEPGALRSREEPPGDLDDAPRPLLVVARRRIRRLAHRDEVSARAEKVGRASHCLVEKIYTMARAAGHPVAW